VNQRWEEGRARWRPAGELIRTSEYEVSEMPKGKDPVAIEFIKRHHYSGSVPSGRFSFGLYRHGILVGVAMFSYPTNDRTLTNVFPSCEVMEATELGRFVLLDEVPGNGETWFLARAFDRLRGRIRGVVSFSDPMPRRSTTGGLVLPGHVGTIYQAANAAYLGRATARTLRLLPDGTVFNDRTIQKIRAQEDGWGPAVEKLQSYGAGTLDAEPAAWLKRWLPIVSRPLRHRGNHRYAWALDRRLRRELPAGLPTPKQVDQEAA